MTYCTFLEREYLTKYDDGSVGYRSGSTTKTYDTATNNPKHSSAIKGIAGHTTSGALKTPNSIGGDRIDKYKDARKRDMDIAKKADKMAKKATGVRNSDYRKMYKDDDALERANKRELAADAARRHIRRHGYTEAGIFANIELI